MKTLNRFCTLFLIVLIFSCSPTSTEIWINEDGSGKSKTTMDLGEYIDMLGPMLASLDEEGGSENTEDEISARLFGEEEDIDSTLVFFDIMPDSIKELLDYPELMKNITMHVKSVSEEKIAFMSVTVEFDDEDHLNAIKDELSKSKKSENEETMMGANDEIDNFFAEFSIDIENKTITLPESKFLQETKNHPESDSIMIQIDSLKYYAEDSHERRMLELLYGSEMEYIIHAPGKVISCSVEDATIEENTVSYTINFLEILQSRKNGGAVIKYQ